MKEFIKGNKKLFIFALIILVLGVAAIIFQVSFATRNNNNDEDTNLLYNQVKKETITENKGAKYTGEHADAFDKSGTKDIYYYTQEGSNNVVLGKYCWQILRTTDTGGVKLIYNGEYDENNKCNNIGAAQQIGEYSLSSISIPASLAYVGYMYNPDTLVTTNFGSSLDDSLYGKGVTYNNGEYTLTDTSSTSDNYHHYTCNNTSGVCSTIRYYYNTYDTHCYVEISDGRTIEEAVNDMLYADNVNKTDSRIKTYIDNWYSSNMVKYSSYLEDTVFCNDRSQQNAETNGWNPNGGSINGKRTTNMFFKNYTLNNDLSCSNETDRFSTLNNKAKLTYKVGLATAPEMYLLDNLELIKTGTTYWLLSPYQFHSTAFEQRSVFTTIDTYGQNGNVGVRPSISLNPNTVYSSGTGTVFDPYVIDVSINYIVNYVTDNNGTVNKNNEKVSENSNPTGAISTPNNGYRFKGWICDKNVTLNEDTVIVAGNLMTSAQLAAIKVTDDITLTAVHESIPDDPVPTDMNVTRIVRSAPNKVTNEFTYSITPDSNNPASVSGIPSTFKITFNNESSTSGVAQKGININFDEAVYSKPGDYKFTVQETGSTDSTTYPLSTDKWEVSVSVRYRQSGGSPTSDLIVKSVVMKKVGETNKDTGMTFESESKFTYITISNTVEGNMADTEKYFKVKVDIEGTTGDTYTILGQDSNVTYNGESVTPQTVYTVGQNNYIYLKHGQSITIGKKAPTRGTGETSEIKSGVSYSFVEDNAGDSALYETYINNSSTNSKTSANLETDIDESNNTNPILNVYNADTMTGKFLKVLPYIGIVLVAIIGIVFMTIRKMRYKEEE